MPTHETQVGSPEAAQDLYGLGVRVGFYLQALGMILYNYSNKEDYGKGLKLASGSITVSILASWFVFVAYRSFSPSEAVIVLLVLISLSFPAKTTLLNPRTIVGETTGLTILLVIELGTCSALLWTFAWLVNTLPTFGTDNVVFFFAKVAINGWFRILALVYCVIDAVTSISFAYKVTRVIAKAWGYKTGELTPATAPQAGDTVANGNLESEIEEIIKWSGMKTMIRWLGWLTWILVVVAVELTVRWNHLSPSTNLQAPGQLIPFATGIIIFTDSIFVVGRQAWPRYEKLFFKFMAATMNHVNAGLSWLVRIDGSFAERRRKLLQSTFLTDAVKFAREWREHKVRPKRPSQNATSSNIQISPINARIDVEAAQTP
ncbi:hypothetical protein F5B21DRAFT_520550 [Xylaria acuta]|nr:hypothetical protein F5B21DRAFT_520550 [Xylaria acuta]